MTIQNSLNPFNTLFQDNILSSDKPEIEQLNEYALNLKNQEQGNLDRLVLEYKINQLAFVRQGITLAEIKYSQLYKNNGYKSFTKFCQEKLRKQPWQVRKTIKAALVVLKLIHAGFDILPTNISQAVTLAKLTTEELIEAWGKIIKKIPLDKITVKSIRNFLFPKKEEQPQSAKIEVPNIVSEDIRSEAAKRGLSVTDFLLIALEFFLKNSVTTSAIQGFIKYAPSDKTTLCEAVSFRAPNVAVSSRLLKFNQYTKEYVEKRKEETDKALCLGTENSETYEQLSFSTI